MDGLSGLLGRWSAGMGPSHRCTSRRRTRQVQERSSWSTYRWTRQSVPQPSGLATAQLHCHPHYARPVPLRACPSHGRQSPHTASPGSPKGPPVLSRHCNLVPAASDLTPRSVDGVCKGVARAHVRQPHRRCCVLPARTLHRADVLVCHRIDAGDRTCRQACGLEIGEKCALRLARGLRCIAR